MIVGTIKDQNVETFTVKIKGLDSNDVYRNREDLKQCHGNDVLQYPGGQFKQCIGEIEFKDSNGLSIRFVMLILNTILKTD